MCKHVHVLKPFYTFTLKFTYLLNQKCINVLQINIEKWRPVFKMSADYLLDHLTRVLLCNQWQCAQNIVPSVHKTLYQVYTLADC